METTSTSSPSYEPASRLLVGKKGVAIKLSKATAVLLEALIDAGQQGVSRKQLHKIIWGHDYTSDDALNHLVSRLRHKIKASGLATEWRIETIPNYGYRLCQHNTKRSLKNWVRHVLYWLRSKTP
ncbi:winged helix-turn-helix domain-containing protein [Saliniradius amylolyticus]|uniref:winged helix-turn-helix domain-containing protein n=1 Tax=Saliniradius amylolyticus TaxID=2183582 RepID=UPI000D6920E9|nr:helix-turn-helix domain-containing protein [Saliniradius amylolyticus]